MSPLLFSSRATLFLGQIDCYVRRADGATIVTVGRVATLEQRAVVDAAMARCRIVDTPSGPGAFSDEFVDALIAYSLEAGPSSGSDIAIAWLRAMIIKVGRDSDRAKPVPQ
jgi:hypothetical protein